MQQHLQTAGKIDADDLQLFQVTESGEEARQVLVQASSTESWAPL
jgi:hypothetical protein